MIVRSHEELAIAIRANPFGAAPGEKRLYVAFLGDVPSAEAIARLDPERSPSDRFIVAGKDIYLELHTGAAKTKLTNAWMDSKLSTVSTMRNWATVLKLHEMTKP